MRGFLTALACVLLPIAVATIAQTCLGVRPIQALLNSLIVMIAAVAVIVPVVGAAKLGDRMN